MSLYEELYGAMRSCCGVLSVMDDKRSMALLCQAGINHRDACFFHGSSHKMNKHIDISCACALQLLTGIPCMNFNAWRYMHVVAGRAELLEEARKKIGSTPLEIAAQDFPIEAWRAWATTFPRDYTENSQVCTALLSQEETEALSKACCLDKHYLKSDCHSHMLELMRGRDLASCSCGAEDLHLWCILLQEFPERLRIFVKNAEVVRTENEHPDCKTDPSRVRPHLSHTAQILVYSPSPVCSLLKQMMVHRQHPAQVL